jgi:hypothetical protein
MDESGARRALAHSDSDSDSDTRGWRVKVNQVTDIAIRRAGRALTGWAPLGPRLVGPPPVRGADPPQCAQGVGIRVQATAHRLGVSSSVTGC